MDAVAVSTHPGQNPPGVPFLPAVGSAAPESTNGAGPANGAPQPRSHSSTPAADTNGKTSQPLQPSHSPPQPNSRPSPPQQPEARPTPTQTTIPVPLPSQQSAQSPSAPAQHPLPAPTATATLVQQPTRPSPAPQARPTATKSQEQLEHEAHIDDLLSQANKAIAQTHQASEPSTQHPQFPRHPGQTTWLPGTRDPPLPALVTTDLAPSHQQPPMMMANSHSRSAKVAIADPPASRQHTPNSPAVASGFPSPTRDYARESSKFVDDCTRLAFAIQQSIPEAVRRVIRDNWEKCLLGSDFHQAFILNAAIHHANVAVTRRAIRDFGAKMVADCMEDIVRHMSTRDIDLAAEDIISKASDSFLDRCLEKRLATIEAKPLINFLARAERLGYEPGDAGEEEVHTSPTSYAPAPAVVPSTPVQPPADYTPQSAPSSSTPQCMKCFRTFAFPSAYDYHMSKNVCSRVPPTADGFKFSCQHCGQGFTTVVGLQYHNAKKVCGDFLTYTPPHRGPGRPPNRTFSGSSPSLGHQATQQANKSARAVPETERARLAAEALAAKAARTVTDSKDPYGHMTSEQLEAMMAELHEAEQQYAIRLQQAEAEAPTSEAARNKLDGLRNSFGTKQSLIRKKYGVRLRERRTKAEIEAERQRMGLGQTQRQSHTWQASPGGSLLQPAVGPPQSATSSVHPAEVGHSDKRRRIDNSGTATPTASSLPSARDELDHKKVAVADMTGGLSGTPATAAHQDPTLPPSNNGPRPSSSQPAKTHAQIHPTPSRTPSAALSQTSAGAKPAGGVAISRGSEVQAVELSDSDSSSDEDGDIPATLPAHIRQSFVPAKPAVDLGGA